MRNKFSLLVILSAVIFLSNRCSQKSSEQHAVIQTNLGDIEVLLYNETPVHRDNFIKLIKSKFYDDLLFHRCIPGFVIQGGDPNSKNAPAGQMLGAGEAGDRLKSEIGLPHYRGALAMARDNNPQKMSSSCQFYIVTGNKLSEMELNQWEMNKHIKYNAAQKQKYLEAGGLPSLDGEYTVFGEVVRGMDVVDKISTLPQDQANRPTQNVTMHIRLN